MPDVPGPGGSTPSAHPNLPATAGLDGFEYRTGAEAGLVHCPAALQRTARRPGGGAPRPGPGRSTGPGLRCPGYLCAHRVGERHLPGPAVHRQPARHVLARVRSRVLHPGLRGQDRPDIGFVRTPRGWRSSGSWRWATRMSPHLPRSPPGRSGCNRSTPERAPMTARGCAIRRGSVRGCRCWCQSRKWPRTGSTWTCGWPARPRCSRFPATMW